MRYMSKIMSKFGTCPNTINIRYMSKFSQVKKCVQILVQKEIQMYLNMFYVTVEGSSD